MNPYISEILAQPSALHDLLNNYSVNALEKVNNDLKSGKYDRILITGMGSSFNSAYPAVVQLSRQSVPVQYFDASELLHHMDSIISSRTLLWMNSQSGRSVELVRLLDILRTRPPATILTFVNDALSPMASRADVCVDIHAGAETTVSTKTYVNMLAANLLAALHLTGGDLNSVLADFSSTADLMETYLASWQSRLDELDSLLGEFDSLFFLGRGASLSACWNGSLINKEAARCAFESMNSAYFRHGPLELASPGLTAMVFAGSPRTADLNRTMALEIVSHGGHCIWLDSDPDPELPTLLLPKTSDFARPLVEILPLQMLTLVMARRKGLQAGHFRYIGKVTDRE